MTDFAYNDTNIVIKNMNKVVLTFKPKQVTRTLLSSVSERAQDVLKKRYGLGTSPEKLTLEAIGKIYGITRERVRQIENFALSTIRRSDRFTDAEPVFTELKEAMQEFGGIVKESDFLEHLSSNREHQNNVHFLLVVGDHFARLKEDDEFHHRWTVNQELAGKVHKSLSSLEDSLSKEDLVTEDEIITRFLEHLRKEIKFVEDEMTAKRWLNLSKLIGKNPLDEWGKSVSPNIKARGIRDLAFLVLRNHGSPMHFTEVAEEIEKKFNRRAHQATVHNELIKDKRFVLVGRGLYALSEWGYERGVVRDVIRHILNENGPLTKDEVIDKVLKERHVKKNTILVNLQNSKYFKKNKNGRYTPV